MVQLEELLFIWHTLQFSADSMIVCLALVSTRCTEVLLRKTSRTEHHQSSFSVKDSMILMVNWRKTMPTLLDGLQLAEKSTAKSMEPNLNISLKLQQKTIDTQVTIKTLFTVKSTLSKKSCKQR